MAPHSSTLAWKITWTEEPGRLQSMGSLRVRQDWATSLSLFTFLHWRRKWQPTPVFLPGESQGRGSLVGCRLWGRTVGHDWSDLAAAAMNYQQLRSFNMWAFKLTIQAKVHSFYWDIVLIGSEFLIKFQLSPYEHNIPNKMNEPWLELSVWSPLLRNLCIVGLEQGQYTKACGIAWTIFVWPES